MSEFESKVAVVTGASSGIGEAAARLLAAAGARVVLFARSAERLASIVAAHPGSMHAVAGSVTSDGDVDSLFAQAEERFGPVELLVNSAGDIDPRLVTEMTSADWTAHIDVNLNAMFRTCRRALPSMIERRAGAIVNVASISGVAGSPKFPRFTAYAAAKGGVLAFTEALAVEVKEHGIRVNSVSPGSVATPMLHRANPALVPDMQPEEVAESILFLLSARSRPMNGQNLHVYSV